LTKIPAIPRPAPHRQTQSTIRSSYIQKRRHVAGSAFQNSCAAMRAHWLGANEALIFRDHNLKCTSLPSSEDDSEKRAGSVESRTRGPGHKKLPASSRGHVYAHFTRIQLPVLTSYLVRGCFTPDGRRQALLGGALPIHNLLILAKL